MILFCRISSTLNNRLHLSRKCSDSFTKLSFGMMGSGLEISCQSFKWEKSTLYINNIYSKYWLLPV